MKQPDIHLHIDRLVLDGFEHVNRHAIREAVTEELARRFAEQGFQSAPAENAEVRKLDGGTITASRNEKSDLLGTKIARSIYEGLNK